MIQLLTSWVCPNGCDKIDESDIITNIVSDHDKICQDNPDLPIQCAKCTNEGDPDNCCGNAMDEAPCPGFEIKHSSLKHVRTMQPRDDFGLWRCSCGERPQSFTNNGQIWFQCINDNCTCFSTSEPEDNVPQARLNWNTLLQAIERWERVGEVTELNAEITHDLESMFTVGKVEPLLREVSVECRMNIRVEDEISSEDGVIKVNKDFDLMEPQLVDADIWVEMARLSKDKHSGFKNMFLYTRGTSNITEYRLEFIFEE